ncbi:MULTISPECIES: hypothetical protein [Lysinibacillus]|jgi:hypothetical protein|uniref:hypothetical protein n=1 Tax=Lysinibacillus TaxID=400634 RepID=UPI0004D7AC93|nr:MULTISPECIES: hypothetical protein [Lysinibacillus]AJK87235.1 hypothetical protein HR49_08715 [Lysinibacillus fusiformis]KHK53357.1 hypothetical protein PI85_09400 [Lysinibacillus sp. A1]WRS97148.1 hypothetical protein VO178_17480 [Lysinibacillus fusiformis]
MSITSYERIKNSIMLDFEEYIEEEGLNVAQVSAKILEEDWRRVNVSLFTKTLYFVSIAIESLKYKEIADFIYSKLDSYLENIKFEEHIDKNDIEKLLQDTQICKKLIDNKDEYKIRNTSDSTKAGVDYILRLKVD